MNIKTYQDRWDKTYYHVLDEEIEEGNTFEKADALACRVADAIADNPEFYNDKVDYIKETTDKLNRG
tara:strand:+ start:17 stop:217 length:201 start_codon:yes stop_codon:yes gene_type:complete